MGNPNGRLTHGQCYTRAYSSWGAMKRRCDLPSQWNYPYYGGRGISYDPRWKTFENFLSDMGPCPEGLSLDRVDSNKDYSKDNCRWADKTTQVMNRRNALLVEFRGEVVTLKSLCEQYKIKYTTLRKRIFVSGVKPEDAVIA